MKKNLLFICLAVSALTVGCKTDGPEPTPEAPATGHVLTITASAADDSDFVWENGDALSINGHESSHLENVPEGATSAAFDIVGATAPLGIISPASAYSAGGNVSIPNVQTYVENGYDRSAYVQYAYLTADDIVAIDDDHSEAAATLTPAVGIVSVPVVIADGSAAITRVELATADGTAVSGTWNVDFSAGMTLEKGFDNVVVDAAEAPVELSASPVYFNFVVLAGKYDELLVTVSDNAGHNFVNEYTVATTVAPGAEAVLDTMTFKLLDPQDVTLNLTIQGQDVTWAEDDAVVVNGVLSSKVLSSAVGTQSASVEVAQVVYPYSVFYPADLYTSSGRLRLYDTQQLIPNGVDRTALAMVGYSTSETVELYNLCGLLTIPVKNGFETETITLNSVTIKARNGEPLSGKYTINYRSHTITPVEGATEAVLTLEAGEQPVQIQPDETVVLTAVVPAGAFPQGLYLDLDTSIGITEDKEVFANGSSNIEVRAGVNTAIDTIEYSEVKIEQIMNADEFEEFIKAANSGRFARFVNSESGEVELGADIDLAGYNIPSAKSFDGIFNGNDHSLKNWTSNTSLFTELAAGAVVKNLVIDSSCTLSYPNANDLGAITYFGFITGTNAGATLDHIINNANITLNMAGQSMGYQMRYGAIVGQSNDGSTISYCENHGNISITADNLDNTATGATATQYFGTVQGAMTGNSTTMEYCVNTGDITVTITGSTAKHGTYIGGVSATANSGSSVYNCSNSGNVTFNIPVFTSNIFMGGVISYAAKNVADCVNTGDVVLNCKGDVNSVFMGGITGYASGELNKCENKGAVTLNANASLKSTAAGSISSAYTSIGGIVGIAYASATQPFAVIDSTNDGPVTLTLASGNNPNANGRVGIGGICGAPYGALTRDTNNGTVTVTVAKGQATDATGGANQHIFCTGGIAGCDFYGQSANTLAGHQITIIDGCINNGTINCDINCAKSNNTCGGIVGWPGVEGATFAGAMKNCENKGNINLLGSGKVRCGGLSGGTNVITDSTNRGNITIAAGSNAKDCTVGGVIGFLTQPALYVSGSYNYGNVISNSAGANILGGLAGGRGNNNNTVKGCYVNCTVSCKEGDYAGMLVGMFNGANAANHTGSEAEPIRVKGKLDRRGEVITIDAENASNREYMLDPTHANYGSHQCVSEYWTE